MGEEEDFCACLPSELFPGHHTSILNDSCSSLRASMDSPSSSTRSVRGQTSTARNTKDQINGFLFNNNNELGKISSSLPPQGIPLGRCLDMCDMVTTHSRNSLSHSFANHCPVAGSVYDHFHDGYVLQATSENLEKFQTPT